MAAMPTNERCVVKETPQVMQFQYHYAETGLLTRQSYKNPEEQHSDERRASASDMVQVNIFDDGWDDDDGDCGASPPIQPHRPRFTANSARSPDVLLTLKQEAPEVVVLPASPLGSLASASSARSSSPFASSIASTDHSEFSDSESDKDYGADSEESADGGKRHDTSTISPDVIEAKLTRHTSNGGVTSPSADLKKRQTSPAGQAAKNYLMMRQLSGPVTNPQCARKFSDSPTKIQRSSSRVDTRKASFHEQNKSPAGLQRSSSRVKTRGVQGRIRKTHSHQAALTERSRSEEGLGSQDVGTKNEDKTSKVKQRSGTLDRSFEGAELTMRFDDAGRAANLKEHLPNDGDRKVNDDYACMKTISNQKRKSRSLDSTFMKYLHGLSKHASAPNSPKCNRGGTGGKKEKNLKARRQSKDTQNSEDDDEEEFRKFTATVAAKTRTSVAKLSPDLSTTGASSINQKLSEYAKDNVKAHKLPKKRLHGGGGGLAGKFSFGKYKTIGRISSDTKSNNFAESAQAFHELLTGENGSEILSNNSEIKPDRFKPEKRKSWRKRHGLSMKSRQKEKINSDPSSPPTTPNDHLEKSSSMERNLKSPPQIKQSLGYSPNCSPDLRIRDITDLRQRTASNDWDDTPSHSPRIISQATARSLTLDNRKKKVTSGSDHARSSSGGLLGIHNKLKQVSSLNSDNSGSNSDISTPFDDDFDDNHAARAGTFSRLLGRKTRAAKLEPSEFESVQAEAGPHYSTGSLGRYKAKHGKYATLHSPAMALRTRRANSKEMLLDMQPLDPIDAFFLPKKFARGFRVNYEEQDEDGEMDMDELGQVFEAAGLGKYATITAAKVSKYWNRNAKYLPKQDSDPCAESDNQGAEGSPVIHRRNKSLPTSDIPLKVKSSKGKGIVAALSRTLQRGSPGPSSNHLAFNDILTENETIDGSTERHRMSPLRSRKVQLIEPLVEVPSVKVLSAAKTLYRRLLRTRPDFLQTRSAEEERDDSFEIVTPVPELAAHSYRNSAFGQDLVTWLVGQMPNAGGEANESSADTTEARKGARGMLQALLEEGAISHVRREHHFQDSYLLYQFHESVTKADGDDINIRPVSVESTTSTANSDAQSTTSVDTNDAEIRNNVSARRSSCSSTALSSRTAMSNSRRWVPSSMDEQELKEALSYLQSVAPDAILRMVLRKLPEDRTAEELMTIYEEILHIKALGHLSDSVKRELAGVLKFEFHRKRGKTLFSQGDEGRSWYIILKGAVDVDVQGQGVVCTLHEGDDFGNLAIINDAPRAATIMLVEDNCQFLRVDKHDFVRILKDVEANTVRLTEHEKDVLILQKIHARTSSVAGRQEKLVVNGTTKSNQRMPLPAAATPTRTNHRYAISAGTPAKIVEHVVKSLKPWSTAKQCDEAMEDLILMYQVFMSTQDLCKFLMSLYQSEKSEQIDSSKSIKRKVVYFVVRWSHIATHIFYDQPAVGPFLKELKQAVTDDGKIYPKLKEDLTRIYLSETGSAESPSHRGWISVESSSTVQRFPPSDFARAPHQAIKATDDVMLKVNNANRTYTTVRLPVISTVSEVVNAVAEKQGRSNVDLQLIQVKSDGDMYVLAKDMTSAATSLGVNSRLFICSPSEKNEIEPLDEQRVVPDSNSSVLELTGSQEIAEHVTQFDWELVNSIHVMEFVHKVFGSHKFHSVTSNIDVFARRFNQLAYWAPTEICACSNANKRVHLLRKFIKIAQHLKELQNMNAFMAVMIGLGNQALSRLHGTWDKLPTKYKKLMAEFEAVLDPSRNHRAYRLYVANLRPPMIPYLPLLMKDMTFQHEGNDSKRNDLINFEKMHMMSNTIRGVIQACCKPLEMSHAVIASKSFDETRQYTRNFGVVTDHKLLSQLTGRVESKR